MSGYGSGQAAATALQGWLDRRPAALRDLLTAVLTAVLAGVAQLVGAVNTAGWDALGQGQVWADAALVAGAALGAWCLLVLTPVTRAYGTGSGRR